MKDRDGYSIHPGVFTPAEMLTTLDALDRAPLQRTRAGARHVLSVSEVRALAEDERLLRIAPDYVGPGAVAYRATLFDKSPTANWLVAWHQDIALPIRRAVEHPAWGPWSHKGGVLHAIASTCGSPARLQRVARAVVGTTCGQRREGVGEAVKRIRVRGIIFLARARQRE